MLLTTMDKSQHLIGGDNISGCMELRPILRASVGLMDKKSDVEMPY